MMRTSLQALRHFLKQDLRDYRLKDYDALPARARWLLLGTFSIFLCVICIIIWRVIWFNDWQGEHNALQTRLLRQIDLLSLKEREYQTFLISDRVAEVNLLLEEIQSQQAYHHDFDHILDEIIAMMSTFTGEVVQFAPRFELLELPMIGQEKSQYRSGIMQHSTTAKSSSNLDSRNLTLLWDRLQDQGGERSFQADLPLERLSLTLELCGDQKALYLLFEALANLPNYLTYVESLTWENGSKLQDRCNSRFAGYLQGLFYIYPLKGLTAYSSQLLQNQVVEGAIPLPVEITHIKQGWEQWKIASYHHQLKDGSIDISRFFFKGENGLKDQITQNNGLVVWKVGELYQGYRLVGLLTAQSQRYAIIAADQQPHHLEIVTEGVSGIQTIDIPARQVLLSPSVNIVKER